MIRSAALVVTALLLPSERIESSVRAPGAEPTDCARYDEWSAELGSIPLHVDEFAVASGYAYVLDEDGGLQIVDARDPGVMRVVARLSVTSPIKSVCTWAGLAYAKFGKWIGVFDLSNPEAPRLIRQVSAPTGGSLRTDGRLLWLVKAPWGAPDSVFIYDLAIRDEPRFASVLLGSAPGDPASVVSDTLAFVIPSSYHVDVYNIANPNEPIRLGRLPGDSAYHGVVFRDGLLYTVHAMGITVYELTDDARFRRVGVAAWPYGQLGEWIFWPRLDRDRLYVMSVEVIGILDVANPNQPRLLGTCSTGGTVHPPILNEGRIYIAGVDSLWVREANQFQNHPVVGGVGLGDWPIDAVRVDNRLYEVGGIGNDGGVLGGLTVVDVSDPRHPQKLGRLEIPLHSPGFELPFEDVAAAGDFAYLNMRGNLQVVDVSVPACPRVVRDIATSQRTMALATNGEILVCPGRADTIDVFRLREAGDLEPLTKWSFPGPVHRMMLADTLALLATNGHGVHLVSIQNPQNPRLLATAAPEQTIHAIALRGKTLFALGNGEQIWAFDIGNPEHPRERGSIDLTTFEENGAVDIAVVGSTLYVAGPRGGTVVVDVSDLERMRPLSPIMGYNHPVRLLAASDVVFEISTPEPSWGGGSLLVLSPRCGQEVPGWVSDLEAQAEEDAIVITWSVGGEGFSGFVIRRKLASNLNPAGYQALNADSPVPSHGPHSWADATIQPGLRYAYSIRGLRDDGSWSDFGPVFTTAPAFDPVVLRIEPNPVRGSARITFRLSGPGLPRLDVVDVSGRRLARVTQEHFPDGPHTIDWRPVDAEGHTLGSGVYWISLQSEGLELRKRFVLIR